MGAQVSCDVCDRLLDEQADDVHVYVCKNATQEHVCVTCFNPETHKDHVKRSVYNVVGEENVRRLNENGPGAQNLANQLERAFEDCIQCECGARTVRREGVVSCFSCGKAFEA